MEEQLPASFTVRKAWHWVQKRQEGVGEEPQPESGPSPERAPLAPGLGARQLRRVLPPLPRLVILRPCDSATPARPGYCRCGRLQRLAREARGGAGPSAPERRRGLRDPRPETLPGREPAIH